MHAATLLTSLQQGLRWLSACSNATSLCSSAISARSLPELQVLAIPCEVDGSTVCHPGAVALHMQPFAVFAPTVHKLCRQPETWVTLVTVRSKVTGKLPDRMSSRAYMTCKHTCSFRTPSGHQRCPCSTTLRLARVCGNS